MGAFNSSGRSLTTDTTAASASPDCKPALCSTGGWNDELEKAYKCSSDFTCAFCYSVGSRCAPKADSGASTVGYVAGFLAFIVTLAGARWAFGDIVKKKLEVRPCSLLAPWLGAICLRVLLAD